MEEILKKIIQGDQCCTFSIAVNTKDKIYVFGKSSLGFSAVIKASLDVDVNCYAANSRLFVCKVCYHVGRSTGDESTKRL